MDWNIRIINTSKALDNESNNIANVNTVGYKAGKNLFCRSNLPRTNWERVICSRCREDFRNRWFKKVTGVDYDVALQGDGFFTVINKNTLGTAETFYTRAGNFRMGENGTLQNPDGFEIQGWAMSSIDQKMM